MKWSFSIRMVNTYRGHTFNENIYCLCVSHLESELAAKVCFTSNFFEDSDIFQIEIDERWLQYRVEVLHGIRRRRNFWKNKKWRRWVFDLICLFKLVRHETVKQNSSIGLQIVLCSRFWFLPLFFVHYIRINWKLSMNLIETFIMLKTF